MKIKAIIASLLLCLAAHGDGLGEFLRALAAVESGNNELAVAWEDVLTDRQIIAITILAEAGGEGKAGMYAVGCVIQERARIRKMSPNKICLQKKQFSCWNSKNIKIANLLKHKQYSYAMVLSEDILNNKLNTKIVNDATHYHTLNSCPIWSKGRKPVRIIGNHVFFKI